MFFLVSQITGSVQTLRNGFFAEHSFDSSSNIIFFIHICCFHFLIVSAFCNQRQCDCHHSGHQRSQESGGALEEKSKIAEGRDGADNGRDEKRDNADWIPFEQIL